MRNRTPNIQMVMHFCFIVVHLIVLALFLINLFNIRGFLISELIIITMPYDFDQMLQRASGERNYNLQISIRNNNNQQEVNVNRDGYNIEIDKQIYWNTEKEEEVYLDSEWNTAYQSKLTQQDILSGYPINDIENFHNQFEQIPEAIKKFGNEKCLLFRSKAIWGYFGYNTICLSIKTGHPLYMNIDNGLTEIFFVYSNFNTVNIDTEWFKEQYKFEVLN